MTTAEIVGDKIHISTTYQERHLASQIAGAAYKKDLEVWQLPISWPACLTIRGVFGTDVELGPKLIDWAWKERENRILPAMTMRDSLALEDHGHSDIDTIEFGHKLKLFPYQRVDAEFLALNRRALLANPPGLGKTGATIRTIQLLQERGENPYPAVVVCPNSLKFTVWQEGFNEWAEGVAVAVIDGSAAKRRKQLAAAKEWADSGAPTVIVMNWESVRLHSRLAPYGNTALTESEKTPKELNELGHRTVIFTTGKIRLGDVICYEIGFDGLVGSDVAAGANLLAMQTNDATFEVDGQTGETLQQLAMARIRAIESDRAVVVASTIGVSAIVAPSGRLITHSGTWQQAVLEARVPLISHRTLADTVGAWPECVIVALTAAALALAVLRGRKALRSR